MARQSGSPELLCPRVLRSDHQLNVRREELRGFRNLGVAVTAAGPSASREAQRRILECSARQQSRFQLQLFSALLIRRRPRLSIESPTSITRRSCLARSPTNFARHLHLVRRYARIAGRDANNASAQRLIGRTRFVRSGPNWDVPTGRLRPRHAPPIR